MHLTPRPVCGTTVLLREKMPVLPLIGWDSLRSLRLVGMGLSSATDNRHSGHLEKAEALRHYHG